MIQNRHAKNTVTKKKKRKSGCPSTLTLKHNRLLLKKLPKER